MKTCLAILSTAVMAALSVVSAQTSEPIYKFPEFLRSAEIKIANDYTPFGNRMQFNRFGDDGSSCVLDSSGVLTWIDSQGTVRLLPDTALAVPLFVTNTECLVWNNRFADFDVYQNRPKAEIKLFRASLGSSTVSTLTVQTEGVEVADTSPITTTTGGLNFLTYTRRNNGEPDYTFAPLNVGNTYDTLDLRAYRMTFDGGVQLIAPIQMDIKGEKKFAETTYGPEQANLGYGSDGSMVFKIANVGNLAVDAYVDRYYWVDGAGRFLQLMNQQINRCVFTSNTRIVFENEVGEFWEMRRAQNGTLIANGTKQIANVDGSTLDISPYTKVGTNRFFYTVDDTDPHTVRTYKLLDAGVDLAFTRTAILPFEVSIATVVRSVNPIDGSAMIVGEDGSAVAWLHAGVTGFSSLPDSAQASPIYVTNQQAVVWNNGRGPVGDDGQLPPVVLTHYERDLVTDVLTRTDMSVIGNSILNSSPYTPTFPYWTVTTSQKTKADTALLRTYQLKSVFISDRDGDGILDVNETNTGVNNGPSDTGTDPRKSDTDDDGWSDYEEIYIYYTDPNKADTDGDGINDREEHDIYGTNPTLVDTDGDGVSDYDEIFVTHTDPTTPSFGQTPDPTDVVDYTSTSVNGSYEGLVYDPSSGFSFKQTLTLSSKGAFSTKLRGLRSDASYRGQFSTAGLYTGSVSADGVNSVQMVVGPNSSGNYVVSGSYQTITGGTLYFELVRNQYSRLNRYSGPSKVTFEASLVTAASGPQGSVVGTGTINTSGVVSLTVYIPDGAKQTFSGPILEGDRVALFSKGSSVLLGNLKIQDVVAQSDFNGPVRLFKPSGRGGMFPSGYDQDRELLGSYFYVPARGTMPLSAFLPTANNTVFRWLDGNFGGINKVGTWLTDNKVSIPKTQNDSASISYNGGTGLMSVRYTTTNTDLNLLKASSTGYAVVHQKSGLVRGYYMSGNSAGSFLVDPNSGGLEPEITFITPTSKTMPAAGGTYTVNVSTKGAWAVEIPSGTTWVTAVTQSESGAGALTGVGNGTVVITVKPNSVLMRDTAVLKIAGFSHTLTRDFR